jgi:transposase-like protein
MMAYVANRMMDMEVEGLTGAAHGERSPTRTNHRNGYRERAWETRVGTVDLEIPKLHMSLEKLASISDDPQAKPRRIAAA